jgi:hypothetical protein
MSRLLLGGGERDARRNAALTWLLVAFVAGVAVTNLSSDDRLWGVFAAVVAVLVAVPPIVTRSYARVVPWEVVAVAAVPLFARTIGTPGTGRVATFLGVAAVALVVAVELDRFTTVEMNRSFAVLFVVLATMAAAGSWAVLRWGVDALLATGFELDERELMLEFVASTVAGVLAGGVFELYFRRIEGMPS